MKRSRTELSDSKASELQVNLLGGAEDGISSREGGKAREMFDAFDYDSSGMLEVSEVRQLLLEQQWILDRVGLEAIEEQYLGDEQKYVDYDTFLKIYEKALSAQPQSIRKTHVVKPTKPKTDDLPRPKKSAKADRINILDLRSLEAATHRVFLAEQEGSGGYITMQDMRHIMRDSGLPDRDGDDFEAVMLRAMAQFDSNSDGRIDFEEFILYRNAVLENFHESDVEQKLKEGGSADPWDEFHFNN